jgi:tungstate transport system ATP-binding protein
MLERVPARTAAPTARDFSAAAARTQNILPVRAEKLVYATAGRKLVDIDELVLTAGGPTLVMGPNGAGKSLLLRLLHGLIEPAAGRISFNGQTMTAAVRRRQAMVFQRPVILRRSVTANIDYALKANGVPRSQRRRRLAQLLATGYLVDKARQAARTLSGGEQQRLALLRALAARPEILFLDEPTSSLDPAATQLIENLIVQAAATGTKIVMVTHDFGQARRLASDVVFLHGGKVTEQTSAAICLNRPRSEPARRFLAGELVT